jgi:hypothetical protein
MENTGNTIIKLLNYLNERDENSRSFLNNRPKQNQNTETLLDVLKKEKFLIDFTPKNRIINSWLKTQGIVKPDLLVLKNSVLFPTYTKFSKLCYFTNLNLDYQIIDFYLIVPLFLLKKEVEIADDIIGNLHIARLENLIGILDCWVNRKDIILQKFYNQN